MCCALKEVIIPDNVTGEIGTRTFFDCESLNYVTVGRGITSIGSDAFRECSALLRITIHENVTKIAKNAFDNDANLLMTMETERDSAAEAYAKEKGIRLKYLKSKKKGGIFGLFKKK